MAENVFRQRFWLWYGFEDNGSSWSDIALKEVKWYNIGHHTEVKG